MHELVVVVDELLRLRGRAEQRRQAGAVRVHDEALVGPPLAAVEVLADDLRGVREGRVGRVRLRDHGCSIGDVLDHHDARIAARRDAHGHDRGEALAVLAAEHHVVLAAADSRDLVARRPQLGLRLLGPVRKRRRASQQLALGEPGQLAHLRVDARDATVRREDHEPVLQRVDDQLGDLQVPVSGPMHARALRARAGAPEHRSQAVEGDAREGDAREPWNSHLPVASTASTPTP